MSTWKYGLGDVQADSVYKDLEAAEEAAKGKGKGAHRTPTEPSVGGTQSLRGHPLAGLYFCRG